MTYPHRAAVAAALAATLVIAACPSAGWAASKNKNDAATAKAAEVRLPFKPPIGMPIRYRIQTTVIQISGTQQKVASENVTIAEVKFLRSSDRGYAVQWTPDVEARGEHKKFDGAVLVAMKEVPVVYQSDGHGKPNTIMNFRDVLGRVAYRVDRLLKWQFGSVHYANDASRQQAEQMIAAGVAQIEAIPLKVAEREWLKEPRILFGAETEGLAVGRPSVREETSPDLASGRPVRATIRAELTDYQPVKGFANIEKITTANPADLKAVFSAQLETTLKQMQPEAAANALKNFEALADTLRFEEKWSGRISLADGIPATVTLISESSGDSSGKREVTTFTRLP